MSIEDDNANLVLADIERSEREILALYEGCSSYEGLRNRASTDPDRTL